jgi:hypothetical protein
MRRFWFLALLSVMFITSCEKEDQETVELFYGQWKTSYGDTVRFERINGTNIMIGWPVWDGAVMATAAKEFSYRKNKLALRDPGPTAFIPLETFQWSVKGKAFTVELSDWSQSTPTALWVLTFTRTP